MVCVVVMLDWKLKTSISEHLRQGQHHTMRAMEHGNVSNMLWNHAEVWKEHPQKAQSFTKIPQGGSTNKHFNITNLIYLLKTRQWRVWRVSGGKKLVPIKKAGVPLNKASPWVMQVPDSKRKFSAKSNHISKLWSFSHLTISPSPL